MTTSLIEKISFISSINFLPPSVQRDQRPVISRAIVLIRENDRRFPDLMPQIRDAVYSTYLKRHGVKGGLRSYNYVVMMVDRYRKYERSGLN